MDTELTTKYQKEGYFLLADCMPEGLLQRWRQLADEIEKESIEQHNNNSRLAGAAVVNDKVGPRLMRFNDVFSQDPELVLETLALPAMLEICRDVVGRGAVPIQMDLLYKQQHPHPVIKWHQGAPHSRNYPYLNVGIYLDNADEGDGCLRYVPGTQHQLQDIDTLSEKFGWELPGVVEQPAKAGDILVQDMMILHGSQPKRSEGTRRTIYVELRPWQSIIESGSQSEQWTELRKQWMAKVLENDKADIWPEDWKKDYQCNKSNASLFEQIVTRVEPPIPAVWGLKTTENKDYPVPEDMKEW